VINSAADATEQFSIDGHILTVIANDFVPVVPYNTTVLTLGIGQRSDIIVTANYSSSSTFWMRSNITCSTSLNPNAVAVVMYDKASTSTIPTSTPQPYTPGCNNDPLASTVPVYAINPGTPATTQTIDITVAQNATGSWLWYMNGTSFRGDYNDPTLLLAKAGNTSYPYSPQFNIINTGSNSSYRFIVNNLTPTVHPLHFHGHNMFVLAVGTGTWDGKTIVNPTNPQRRDVQLVPPFGYMVWQANAGKLSSTTNKFIARLGLISHQDNPGAWPFHCHIAWHAGAGLFVDILENPAVIKNLPIPSSVDQVCSDWSKFSATGAVDQIELVPENSCGFATVTNEILQFRRVR
jgi:FtsP/CotA-like multicopper oxidase with cupredoxin domain